MSRGGSPGRRGFSTVAMFRPGDFAAGRDYFANTGAASRAEVIEGAVGCAKRQDVCPRQIHNVDVVANTCSVGCLVISAVNFDIRFLPSATLSTLGSNVSPADDLHRSSSWPQPR
jgi:hypothetical protein